MPRDPAALAADLLTRAAALAPDDPARDPLLAAARALIDSTAKPSTLRLAR